MWNARFALSVLMITVGRSISSKVSVFLSRLLKAAASVLTMLFFRDLPAWARRPWRLLSPTSWVRKLKQRQDRRLLARGTSRRFSLIFNRAMFSLSMRSIVSIAPSKRFYIPRWKIFRSISLLVKGLLRVRLDLIFPISPWWEPRRARVCSRVLYATVLARLLFC